MPSTSWGKRRNRGFTLLEVVLAIGLTGTLLALLATAIDLYLVRVDANRSKVEAAQLARTLLGQIADDIRSARYYAPENSSSARTGANASGSSSSQGSSESANQVHGIFGTETELRIDRGARWNWARTSRQIDPVQPTSAEEMPTTVAYVFNDGNTLLADQLAAMGVLTDSALPGYAGLYRQQSPTPAWLYQNNSRGINLTSNTASEPQLLAPEVLALEFAYYDGQQLLDSWDSAAQKGLPVAIEIRLTFLKEPFDLALAASEQERDVELSKSENEVKYTLFVRVPERRQPTQSSSSSPSQGSGGNGGSQAPTGGSGSDN